MKRKEEAPAKGADTVKEWMEAHPQEYARFAAKMKTEGIGGVLKLGEDAFRLSPDFQQEVERMVTTGRFDVSSLLEHLALSDFAENYLREKNEDHMAMAAWVKYGESAPEQVADELDKAVVAQDKRTYREMLSSLFKLFWGKFFQRVELHRRCREAEGKEAFTAESFQHMLASKDENRVKRIGAWLGYGRSGMERRIINSSIEIHGCGFPCDTKFEYYLVFPDITINVFLNQVLNLVITQYRSIINL